MNDHLATVAQIKSTVIDLAIKFGPKVFVAMVILVERQQPVFAVAVYVCDQPRQPFDDLRVGLLEVSHCAGA